MVLEVAIDSCLALLQLVQLFLELPLCATVVLHVDEGSATGLGNVTTHLVVKTRHDSLTVVVGHEAAAIRTGNG